jgi:hypothetical protein
MKGWCCVRREARYMCYWFWVGKVLCWFLVVMLGDRVVLMEELLLELEKEEEEADSTVFQLQLALVLVDKDPPEESLLEECEDCSAD